MLSCHSTSLIRGSTSTEKLIGLGWDENPEAKKRHYRRYYPDELENIKEVMPVATPFDQYDVKKG
jgi:hypothetical protein